MDRLKDKICVVTAAGQGIGRASALAMFEEGAHVVATDINAEALEELKGDRPAMGYRHIPAEQTYTNQTLMVEPGQRFYLVSDGFIDQVGGPKHRMLGKKRLADLITACWDQPFAAQKDEILAAFHAYRGEESQRDDLSMVGFTLG